MMTSSSSPLHDDSTLVELQVMGIALDTRTGVPIVVMNDLDKRKALPIWIGTAEASAIIRQLEGIESNRPMTHDLLLSAVESLNHEVERVVIHDLEEDTYFASICLKNVLTEELVELDARPSDAIALALRAEAPIFASAVVMVEGTVSTDQERDEREAEDFRNFLQNIKASDFKKFEGGDIQSDQ
jgi:bifunctional DNase/RNase